MEEPKKWLQLLPWVEYSYNTIVHTSLETNLFQVVYGREPPQLLPYEAQTFTIEALDIILQECDKVLPFLKKTL